MSDDTVMVKPVRTFLEGADLKQPGSEPFPVSRSHAQELSDNGLVVRVEGEPAPAAPASPGPAAPVVEVDPAPPAPRAEPSSPRRRGRSPAKHA